MGVAALQIRLKSICLFFEPIIVNSSQSDFDRTLDDWLYDNYDNYGNNYSSMKNVFRAGNSIRLGFEEAMKQKEENFYQFYLFVRSDVYLVDKIIFPNNQFNGIQIPKWASYGGYNDRLALIGDYHSASIYSLKGEAGKNYSENNVHTNSEGYLKQWLTKNNINVIIKGDDKGDGKTTTFACCVRLRSNGKVRGDDCGLKLKTFDDVYEHLENFV